MRSLEGMDARPDAIPLQLAIHGRKAMLLSSTCKEILLQETGEEKWGQFSSKSYFIQSCGQFEMKGYHGDGNVLHIVLQPIVIIILERSEWKGVAR